MNINKPSQLARHISLRQLQVFESVARLLSFTRAAEELFLSQPTVSMQIKKMEDTIGLPLTEQVGKQIFLTDAGMAMNDTASDILNSLNRLEMKFGDLKGLHTGHLKLAVVSTANYFAPRLLGRFCKDYPGVSVSLEVSNRTNIMQRMSQNLDDLYLIGKPDISTELVFQPYLANPMVVIAPVRHRLAGRKAIPLSELENEPFIMREQGSGTRMALEEKFDQQNIKLNIGIELGNNESIKQGVTGGLGIAVLSQHTLTRGDMNDLTILDVKGFPIQWQWFIGHPKGKRLSVLANTFIDFMQAHGKDVLQESMQKQP